MTPWKDGRWLVLDVETTGIVAGTDRIVELAAIGFERREVTERRCSRVNPGIPIQPAVSAIHGITDEHVKDAPPIASIADRFLARVDAADVLVAYNWPFDAAFLAAELGSAWDDAVKLKPIIDPLVLVRTDAVGRWWKGKGRHKLTAVCERLKVPLVGAHGASQDAHATGLLLAKLAHHLPDDAREAHDMIEHERAAQDASFQSWIASQPAPKREMMQ